MTTSIVIIENEPCLPHPDDELTDFIRIQKEKIIPFCVVGAKLAVSASSPGDNEKHGHVRNKNKLRKYAWLFIGVLLAMAYLVPALGFALPLRAFAALSLLCIPARLAGLRRVIGFRSHREINQELLSQVPAQIDTTKSASKAASEKAISADPSRKKGFESLNELFYYVWNQWGHQLCQGAVHELRPRPADLFLL